MTRTVSDKWRCLTCGTFWPQYWSSCPRCWDWGCVIPWGHRPTAELDSEPAEMTARELSRMVWSEIEQAAYPELKLGFAAFVAVYGHAGAGKSTWACRLADAVPGKALLVSAEEALSHSLAARLLRANIKGDDFVAVAGTSIDKIVAKARKHHAVTMVVDSVQLATWTASELRHAIEVLRLSLLVAVSQVNKRGEPLGENALLHEADAVVSVEDMRWRLTKSRYQSLAGVGGDVLPPQSKEDVA